MKRHSCVILEVLSLYLVNFANIEAHVKLSLSEHSVNTKISTDFFLLWCQNLPHSYKMDYKKPICFIKLILGDFILILIRSKWELGFLCESIFFINYGCLGET